MIALGPEPTALLLKPADILAWCPGLTRDQWAKIRPHLRPVRLPGFAKPFYAKPEVRAKIVEPIARAAAQG